eukprot:TRINITY_DN55090_c0_g1_i1.p1 TRINITY_DN55090_c0_g1~~TRINITY_DN55090_c0_g1_i1.p1  ORF type:complete len:705 (-),score=59.15 TRINITY_DN55090_c0_g1_i1:49-2163(-)
MLTWPLRRAVNAVALVVTIFVQQTPQCRALVPVFPDEGKLFPDWDCEEVYASTVPAGASEYERIDWATWLRVFETRPTREWLDWSSLYLDKLMDASLETYARHTQDCPLGMLNAELLMYAISSLQGSGEDAATWADSAQRNLARIPLRILTGSRWPLFSLLTSDKLRDVQPGGRDIANDPRVNCADIEEPALNWKGFLSVLSEEGSRKHWYERSIRYVWSWQMRSIPDRLADECPLGVLTATVVLAFTCATSESTCYATHARKIEWWLANTPNVVELLAHSRWSLSIMLNHMSRGTRHKFHLDFTETELSGRKGRTPSELRHFGPWAGSLEQEGHSRSFRDLLAVLPHLGPAPPAAPSLVYVTMVYGQRFNRHIRRFCSRARALGDGGRRLIIFALDDEAFQLCLVENEHRCVRGTPSIVNKFTLPLMCARVGLDTVWLDLDVFLMKDPSPAIIRHADRGVFDILVSGSFESDCICNGIVYFRATDLVRNWLLAVIVWMYDHPYEHDQKTFSAFLKHTETVSHEALDLPAIPPWDTLDAINEFVTPDTYEGNGWSGDIENIVIYHFLNGESDTGSDLDPSGTWMRGFGHFDADGTGPPPCRTKGDDCHVVEKVSLMDLIYSLDDEDLFTTPKLGHENELLRRNIMSSRKATRRTDLLGKPCGPLVGAFDMPVPEVARLLGKHGNSENAAEEELLRIARKGGRHK